MISHFKFCYKDAGINGNPPLLIMLVTSGFVVKRERAVLPKILEDNDAQ